MDDAAPPAAWTRMEHATAEDGTVIGQLQPDDGDAALVAVEKPPGRAPRAEDV